LKLIKNSYIILLNIKKSVDMSNTVVTGPDKQPAPVDDFEAEAAVIRGAVSENFLSRVYHSLRGIGQAIAAFFNTTIPEYFNNRRLEQLRLKQEEASSSLFVSAAKTDRCAQEAFNALQVAYGEILTSNGHAINVRHDKGLSHFVDMRYEAIEPLNKALRAKTFPGLIRSVTDLAATQGIREVVHGHSCGNSSFIQPIDLIEQQTRRHMGAEIARQFNHGVIDLDRPINEAAGLLKQAATLSPDPNRASTEILKGFITELKMQNVKAFEKQPEADALRSAYKRIAQASLFLDRLIEQGIVQQSATLGEDGQEIGQLLGSEQELEQHFRSLRAHHQKQFLEELDAARGRGVAVKRQVLERYLTVADLDEKQKERILEEMLDGNVLSRLSEVIAAEIVIPDELLIPYAEEGQPNAELYSKTRQEIAYLMAVRHLQASNFVRNLAGDTLTASDGAEVIRKANSGPGFLDLVLLLAQGIDQKLAEAARERLRKRYEGEMENLNAQIGEKNERIEELQGLIQNQTAVVSQLETEVRALAVVPVNVTATDEDVRRAIAEAKQQHAAASTAQERARGELEAIRANCVAIQREIKDAEAQRAALENRLQFLRLKETGSERGAEFREERLAERGRGVTIWRRPNPAESSPSGSPPPPLPNTLRGGRARPSSNDDEKSDGEESEGNFAARIVAGESSE
jgi:hypothetical protein